MIMLTSSESLVLSLEKKIMGGDAQDYVLMTHYC